MPDPLSPIQRTVMLRRVDPDLGMARFYSLMIERDLFGTVRLVRHWGRIGSMQGRELAQDFASEEDAVVALERLAAAKRRRGYRDFWRRLCAPLQGGFSGPAETPPPAGRSHGVAPTATGTGPVTVHYRGAERRGSAHSTAEPLCNSNSP